MKPIFCLVRASKAYYYKDIVTWVCQAGQSWGPCDGFCGYSELRNDCLLAFVTPSFSPFATHTHTTPKSALSHPTFPLAALAFPTITASHYGGHLLIHLDRSTLCLGSAFLQYSLPNYPTETWCTSASVPFQCQKVVSGVGVIWFVFVFSDF